MFPVLVKIGPVTIHTYGFMMAVGVAFGLWFVYVQAKKRDLPAVKIIDMAFYTIIISLVGAKLVLFIGNASYYIQYPGELLTLARSGGVFQGGLIAGLVFALWYLWKHKIPTWKTADIIAPAVALGHGFGRIGCFSAGCCYGRASSTPLAVTFTSEYAHNLTGIPIGTSIHPVQLYESSLNFLNFIILFIILKKKKLDGIVFSFYIINYSIIRYFTEFYRGDHSPELYLIDNPSPYLSLSLPQLFCLLGVISGIGLIFFLKKKKKRAA
ncbi:MAG: prolipoprotein diacylglyceryl transferase [Candidatus Aminicenantes bacterium]